ncbi:nucleotide sugar dehydrogenase [Candidatus Ruminimicrobium bovinum]|uniref:nucleotide sugar dehydrogenase n=1 Tax=Candidatus Ruminimicrobium bovinum TaxID=3242779 RepID=UPI0039B82141
MHNKLSKKIESKQAKIGIIGLGYVGLPLAVELAKKGFTVTGLEVDSKKVENINNKKSYIGDIKTEDIKELVTSKKLSATTNFKAIAKLDVVIICVPTPLRKSKDPDVSYIVSATNEIKDNLKTGQLIILESTTYPGTTKELVLPMLEETGLKGGKDFFLAFSPERIDPANKNWTIANTTKVVGGICDKSTNLACQVYGSFTKVHKVSSTQAAEMVKLLENTFRAVNIGLVNEVALMCDRLGLNVWEIIDASATKPFGFMKFTPGPGIGGHCIPLDPHYLSWKLKTLNFYSRFIELAGEINSKMPEYVVTKLADTLNEKAKSIKNSKILVLGVAYKKDVADLRESPALDVMTLLIKKQAKLSFYDSYVPTVKIANKILKSEKNISNVSKYDAVLILTDHTNIDYAEVVKKAKLVFDTRNATKNIKSQKVVKL